MSISSSDNPKRKDIELKMKQGHHTPGEWMTLSDNVYYVQCTKCKDYAMYEELTNDTTPIGGCLFLECHV